jgi:hypothetical protein
MRRFFASLVLAGVGFFASGCLELSESFTLNPDGSGKVVVDTLSPDGSQFAPANQPKPKPDELVKKAIEGAIKSKGVDAWSDVSGEIAKDGRVHFHGTAYFPDINKVNINAGGSNSSDNDSSGMSWTKEGDAYKLVFKNKNKAENAPPPEKLTDAQIDEKIKQERVEYQQSKAFIQAFLGNLKVSVSFALPGKITESNILTVNGNTATMTLDGKQMMEAMDKANADDALMREKVKGGKAAEDRIMTKLMFGKEGDPSAKVTDAKPQFDYKAESAKAKAGEAEMWKKLGVTPAAP